jgi:hypothetical protein
MERRRVERALGIQITNQRLLDRLTECDERFGALFRLNPLVAESLKRKKRSAFTPPDYAWVRKMRQTAAESALLLGVIHPSEYQRRRFLALKRRAQSRLEDEASAYAVPALDFPVVSVNPTLPVKLRMLLSRRFRDRVAGVMAGLRDKRERQIHAAIASRVSSIEGHLALYRELERHLSQVD